MNHHSFFHPRKQLHTIIRMRRRFLLISHKYYRLAVSCCIALMLIFIHPLTVLAQTSTDSSQIIASSSAQTPSNEDISFPIVLPTPEAATQSAVLLPDVPQQQSIYDATIPLTIKEQTKSARVKQKPKVNKLAKKLYRSNEAISISITDPSPKQKILITNARGEQTNIQVFRQEKDESVDILIPPPMQFTPGRFTLTILDDTQILSQQDFSWGVLALNPDQPVYKTDARATIAMTVLNDFGETLCTPQLTLSITAPDGTTSNYSMDNGGIIKNEQCGSLSEDAPNDYETQYQFGNIEGIYQLQLTALTDAGPRTILDTIKVSNTESFYIKRKSATRIYPPNWYEMVIQITASETFSGTIIESLPESFLIQEGKTGQSFQEQSIASEKPTVRSSYLSLMYPFEGTPDILHQFGDQPPEEVRSLYELSSVSTLDGVSFALVEETPILAVDDGYVARIGGPYGTTLVIQHDWGRSYYGYLKQTTVFEADRVTKGQVIGLSGKPENAPEPYLHFAIKRTQNDMNNGTLGKIDPIPYLSRSTTANPTPIKELSYPLTIQKGETVTLSYRYKAPLISPQFYLAGPLKFYTNSPDDSASQQTAQTITPLLNVDETLATLSGQIESPMEASLSSILTYQTLYPTEVVEQFNNLLSETGIQATNSGLIQPPLQTIQSQPGLLYTEPRAFQIAADAVPTNLQVKTVEFYAGQYSGNGTTGQNSDTNQTFSTFNFNLAEENVTIRQLIVFFEAQVAAYEDDGDHTGWDLSFDACTESCTANAWSGSGAVTVSDTSILAEDESESIAIRLLANMATESTISSYTGGGTNLEGQVGYRVDVGAADNSIAQAKAKIIVTYTYSPTSDNYTNTVRFPLESTQAGDQGTRRNSIAGNCTRNSTCPVFDYNVNLGETSVTELSSWFRSEYYNDGNSGNDIVQNVNIQGTDTNSSNVILEAARGSAQGNGHSAFFNNVSGYAIESADQLEIYHSTGTIYGIGGEVVQTYSAASDSTTKTKTVSFPFGTVSNGSTTASQSDTVTVYLPETGITIQKAWFRIYSNNITSSTLNLQITSTVEGTSETAAVQYNVNAGGDVPLAGFTLFHVIDSSYYDEIEAATATNGIDVTIESTANSTNIGGVSAELVITYHYTDDAYGYLTNATIFAAQQTTGPATSYTTSAGSVDPYFPEQTGVKTIRGASLESTILTSDSDSNAPGGNVNVDAAISSGSCTNTVAYDIKTDNMTGYAPWIDDVASSLTTTDSTTYTVCIDNDADALDTSNLGKVNALLYYLYQVDLPTMAQLMRHGKWFDNTGTKQAFTF